MTSYQISAVASSSEEENEDEPRCVPHSIGIIQTTANPALLPAALFERPGKGDGADDEDAVRVMTTYCPLQTPTRDYHPDTLDCIAVAAEKLIARGAVVIVLDTGYSALQKELSTRFAGRVPIVATSLLQLASLRIVMPRTGVVTLDRQGISNVNLAAVLADPATPVLGMDPASTWRQLLDPEETDATTEEEEDITSETQEGGTTASIPIAGGVHGATRMAMPIGSLTMGRMGSASPGLQLLPTSYSSTFASVRAFDAREVQDPGERPTARDRDRERGVLAKLRLERLIQHNDQILLDELLAACKQLIARTGSTCIILEEPRFATFTRRLQACLAIERPGVVLFDVVATVQWLYAGYRTARPQAALQRRSPSTTPRPGHNNGSHNSHVQASHGPVVEIAAGVGLPIDGNYIGGSSSFAAASPLSRRAMHTRVQQQQQQQRQAFGLASQFVGGRPMSRPGMLRVASSREERAEDASIIGDTMPMPDV